MVEPEVRPAAGVADLSRAAAVRLEVTPAAAERPFLPALSGMRAFPALWICGAHVFTCWHATATFAPAATDFTRWCAAGAQYLDAGGLSASIIEASGAALGGFFLLSGFVLAYIHLDAARSTEIDLRRFWVARLARVYPVYALALLFGLKLFIVETLTAPPDVIMPAPTGAGIATTMVATGLLVQSWWPRTMLAWNAPAWSLSCEAFCYLVFPVLVRGIDRLRPRTLLALIGVCWLLSFAPAVLYLAIDPEGVGSPIWSSDTFWLRVVKGNPLLRLPEFVAGVALGKLWLQTASRHGAWRRWGAWLSCGGAAFGLTLGALHLPLGIPHLLVFTGFFDPMFVVVVFGLALEGGPVQWILSRRPIALLGDASYALYILHMPALGYTLRLVGSYGAPPIHPLAFVAVVLAIGGGASVLVHVGFEMPMRRLVRTMLLPARGDGWRVAVAGPAPRGDVARAG